MKFDVTCIKSEGRALHKYANNKRLEYQEGRWLHKLDQMFVHNKENVSANLRTEEAYPTSPPCKALASARTGMSPELWHTPSFNRTEPVGSCGELGLFRDCL